MSKILDIIRVTLITSIIGLYAYKYFNKEDYNFELNKYLQIIIFILMAVEAYRMFGPKGKEKE